MKRKPVDVTELFGSEEPKSYDNSKDYLKSLDTESLIETLHLASRGANYDSRELTYIVELNYQVLMTETVELNRLDYWQMEGLKKEIEQEILERVLNDYEKNLEVENKIIELF